MPDIKVKHGIYVDKPPQDVFAFLADPDKITQWQATSYKVARKGQGAGAAAGAGGGKGKLQRGERVHDQRNVLGKDVEGEWEVAEYDQDKRLVFRMVQGNIKWEMAFTLEAQNGGTMLTAEGGGDLGTGLSAAAASRGGQNLIENDLKTLARILEKG